MTSMTSDTYTEAKTGVFWDVEDCPIPEDLDPESVYQNIKTALANKGYHGDVSIRAYGDKNQIPDYYESAGIHIFPEGDKIARVRKMQLEFFGWVRDNNRDLSNIMVITRQGMELASALQSWKESNHNILFANAEHGPKSTCKCNCGAPSANISSDTWVWETLAVGGEPLTKQDLVNKKNKDKEDDDGNNPPPGFLESDVVMGMSQVLFDLVK